MTTDPFERYQIMMNDEPVPAHLPDRVLAQARAQAAASTRPAVHAFSGKRTHFKALAIAACTVLVVGLGALALGPISGARSGEAPLGNFFQMAAYADESGASASGPVKLGADDFFPVRTSSGPIYDSETDSYSGDIEAFRSYNLNLTCTGANVTSITYELQGNGVSFFNWQLTDDTLSGTYETGTSAAHGDQDDTFTVDYDNQDMNAAGSVHHEICLDYTLDDQQKALFDALQAASPHTEGIMPEDERLACIEADNKLDLALAQHDADIISQARLVLTATFADGTTAMKTYRLVPVDDFEQTYGEYLAMRSSESVDQANFPALYTLEELS